MDKTVYIIEDDRDILNMLTIFIKKQGYKVISDYNGDQLDLAHPPAFLYLVDINLKGKNGADICHKIKLEQKDAHVVLMSANPELQKAANECAAESFIPKPFEIQSLLSAIHAYA